MANVLPAAIGATIVAAGAYCELPPPSRSPASPLRGCPAKLRAVPVAVVAVAFAQPAQSLARADSGAGEKKRPQLVLLRKLN